ncbi:hypothetical protein SprV_1002869400 [Sparganum proliferum]
MDDERLPKRLFYGDVATGSRHQGGQIRRYKDTLKSSLMRLHINPTNWEELALERPTWRRTVKTGAAIYEANRIAAAKARIGRVGHLRINCASRTALTIGPRPVSSSSSLPPTNSDGSSDPPLPSSSSSSSSSSSLSSFSSSFSNTTPTTAAQAAVSHTTNPDTTTETTSTASESSDKDQECTCPHCDRTFTSRIGLVGHLRIHRTETGEPVPGAPTPTAPASTAYTALALSRIAWVYSATCASTRTELTAVPTHPSCYTPRPLHHPAPLPHLQQLTPTPPTSPAHTVYAYSPLASARPVTCECIAQRLGNQCLEHQPIPTTLVSTARTALARTHTHSHTQSFSC